MKLTILGCGTSSGVPRIGGDWGACDPADPRNRRSRASMLVQSPATTILVDTGPDMRSQLLAARIGAVDAVIWTHDHADHVHGLDDLRQLYHIRRRPVPGFARPATMAVLEERFGYVFTGRHGYPPTVEPRLLEDDSMVGDIRVRVVDQPHGSITSAGLRFEHDGVALGYATDFSAFTPEMETLFQGIDLWVADALRREPHPTHPHLAVTVAAAARLGARRTLLTHMDQSMDYAALARELPPGMEPAYDGLEVSLA